MGDKWAAPEGVSKMCLWNVKGLQGGESAISPVIPVSLYAPGGYFSTYVSVSGNGKLNLRHLSSFDGTNFVLPSSSATPIVNFTITSGLASNPWQDIFELNPVLAPFMKIQIQEVSGIAISATVWLAMS